MNTADVKALFRIEALRQVNYQTLLRNDCLDLFRKDWPVAPESTSLGSHNQTQMSLFITRWQTLRRKLLTRISANAFGWTYSLQNCRVITTEIRAAPWLVYPSSKFG